MTDNGQTVISSTGTQQGCGLSNVLFALVVHYIHYALKGCGLVADLWFWDDGYLVGSPEAVGRALDLLVRLEEGTGLSLRLSKCKVFTPNTKVTSKMIHLVPPGVKVYRSMDKMEVLKAPVGSDSEIQIALETKLLSLEKQIEQVASLPAKHHACSLLQHCVGH